MRTEGNAHNQGVQTSQTQHPSLLLQKSVNMTWQLHPQPLHSPLLPINQDSPPPMSAALGGAAKALNTNSRYDTRGAGTVMLSSEQCFGPALNKGCSNTCNTQETLKSCTFLWAAAPEGREIPRNEERASQHILAARPSHAQPTSASVSSLLHMTPGNAHSCLWRPGCIFSVIYYLLISQLMPTPPSSHFCSEYSHGTPGKEQLPSESAVTWMTEPQECPKSHPCCRWGAFNHPPRTALSVFYKLGGKYTHPEEEYNFFNTGSSWSTRCDHSLF